MKKSNIIKAFTIVELLVAITISSILALISYMSYQEYSWDARDSKRITNLKDIYTWLTLLYSKEQLYPNPHNYVDIVWLSKQWSIWEEIKNKLKFSWVLRDPKDNSYYLYNLDKNWKKIQVSWFLENKSEILFW